jgi:hypothetical protein
MGNENRNPNGERGSLADAGTIGTNGSAVPLDTCLDDREPQTDPALPTRGRGVCLREALEEVGEEFWGDTLARIRDLDLRLRRGRASASVQRERLATPPIDV